MRVAHVLQLSTDKSSAGRVSKEARRGKGERESRREEVGAKASSTFASYGNS